MFVVAVGQVLCVAVYVPAAVAKEAAQSVEENCSVVADVVVAQAELLADVSKFAVAAGKEDAVADSANASFVPVEDVVDGKLQNR